MEAYPSEEASAEVLPEAPAYDAAKLKRLRESVTASFSKLKPYRDNRNAAVKEYTGKHFGERGEDDDVDRVPVNLIELAASIYLRQLAARAPRALISTRFAEIQSAAKDLELATNHLVDEIDLEASFKSVVLNALFGIGVMKIGMEPAHTVEVDGFLHDVGQPFADSIDLDDFVFDMSAKKFELVQYVGNKYCLPLDYVLECDLYDEAARAKLKAQSDNTYEGKIDTPISEAGHKAPKEDEQYEKLVELWDIYLPRENKLITYCGNESVPPLRSVDWEGPECGPYLILAFSEVPNNIFPLPPVAAWIDLHDLANRLFRKLGRQAERQKTVTFVQKGSANDGKNLGNASDGDMIGVDNPQGVAESKFGGVDATNLAFVLQLKDIFSSHAGNLEILGGLSPQSETLGQDQLLAGNASKRIADMQDRTSTFARKVIRSLAWYLWTDDFIELPLVKRVEDVDIPINYTAEDREGDFLDYNIQIQPYSLQDMTPSARLQSIMQTLNAIGPYMPLFQQSGRTLDPNKLLEIIAQYTNTPELEEIMVSMMPLPGDMPVGEPPGKMQNTKRTYERINRPGATTQGKDATMAQLLMGGNPQDAEKAAMMRPAS